MNQFLSSNASYIKVYFPTEKSAYGVDLTYLTLDDMISDTHGGTIYYSLEVDRINWKSLDQESKRCGMENHETGTTRCITKFVEEKAGCRTMMPMGNANLSIWDSPKQIEKVLPNTKLIQKLGEHDIFEATGCLPPCEWSEFRHNVKNERGRWSKSGYPPKDDFRRWKSISSTTSIVSLQMLVATWDYSSGKACMAFTKLELLGSCL